MATARASAVAVSAWATPGATAPMFPDPLCVIPRNADMTPNTVPRSPIRGLTEPIVARAVRYLPRASRSASVWESSTWRNASTWAALRRAPRSVVATRAGAVSVRKPFARLNTRVNGFAFPLPARRAASSRVRARSKSSMNFVPARLTRRNSSHLAKMMVQLIAERSARKPRTTCVTVSDAVMSSSGVVGMG